MNRELLINEPVDTLVRVLPNGDVRPTSFIWRDRTRYVNDVGRQWEEIVDGRRLHCYLIQAVDNTTYELRWDAADNRWLLHRAWTTAGLA
jgi:hypothetical protein